MKETKYLVEVKPVVKDRVISFHAGDVVPHVQDSVFVATAEEEPLLASVTAPRCAPAILPVKADTSLTDTCGRA